MHPDEARAWLQGERSMWNLLAQGPDMTQAHVATARADAAMTEQAYWVVRAHQEGLVAEPQHSDDGEEIGDGG